MAHPATIAGLRARRSIHAASLANVNDIEDCARIVSECHLTNRSTVSLLDLRTIGMLLASYDGFTRRATRRTSRAKTVCSDGSNYFMLNLVVRYEEPREVSRVSGIPTDWRRSDYNVRAKSLPKLRDLI